MSARVKISFLRSHRWSGTANFEVFYSPGVWLIYPPEKINGSPVPIWQYAWEQAGFGHGRFGYGSFGWGQGGLAAGGFGFGKFGLGEFGYYNAVVEWITPKAYPDGLHSFGVLMYKETGSPGSFITENNVLIRSTPSAPAALLFDTMTDGEITVRWMPSEDVTN